MGKLIATRVSDEVYSKILKKCADSGCSTYDYLKMLIETDTNEVQEIKKMGNPGSIQPALERLEELAKNLKTVQE